MYVMHMQLLKVSIISDVLNFLYSRIQTGGGNMTSSENVTSNYRMYMYMYMYSTCTSEVLDGECMHQHWHP